MDTSEETYNPWSIVNLVFRHLADEGLHPVLGESGDPGKPAAELLTALGITPVADGNKKVTAPGQRRARPAARGLRGRATGVTVSDRDAVPASGLQQEQRVVSG